jgi:murein DD-endopeptidase MepM/ murein hydrolase activator NlpD
MSHVRKLITAAMAIMLVTGIIAISAAQAGESGWVGSMGASHGIDISMPSNAPSIKSDFGATENRGDGSNPHTGIDIAGRPDHQIIATADGVIGWTGNTRAGMAIFIRHSEESGIWSGFDGLTEFLVSKGDKVKRGQPIGILRDYLHFEVRDNDKNRLNAHKYWIGGPGKIVCFDPDAEYQETGSSILTYPMKCY